MSPESKTTGSATALGPEVGEVVERFELEKAWLVDPTSGRAGPGEIVVTDGVLESVVWLEGEEAKGVTDGGVVVAPGSITQTRIPQARSSNRMALFTASKACLDAA